MPLPFLNNNPEGKKFFICFCCGKMLPSILEFRAHIKENHEENKDFITCPLDHCQAPVRDMRKHFALCHKHSSIPDGTRLRAITWRDPKDMNKKKRKLSFEEGTFKSTKNRKNLHYRS